MGKIFAQPARVPVRPNLFDITPFAGCLDERPRAANATELAAYLYEIAERRGIVIPADATYSPSGVYHDGERILATPGYGADTTVTMETLDEAGDVIRTTRIAVNAKGQMALKAAAVVDACALPKVAKPRKPRAVKEAKPAAQPKPIPTPVCQPDATAALLARLEALEAAVARMSRPVEAGKRQRSEAERRAILRAWRMRREMRERADLDRRALEAANGAYRGALDTLAAANAQIAAARADSALHVDRHALAAAAYGRAMNRADRLARIAIAGRTSRRRLADDLRGAQAEAKAIARRLAAARTTAAAIPAIFHHDSGAVAALV